MRGTNSSLTQKFIRLGGLGQREVFLKVSRPWLFTACCLIIATLFAAFFPGSKSTHALKTVLRPLLLNELNFTHVPIPGEKVDTIYILGGGQSSLGYKYKKCADIYRKGICTNIWILSRSGKTEYDASLGRNLSNDEWSIKKLENLGVLKEHITAVTIEEGFFGTLSEAKDVSSLITSRGHTSILLITSDDHTYRAKMCFDKYLKVHHVLVYVQSSAERILLRHLIVEFIKLKIYQYFLIR